MYLKSKGDTMTKLAFLASMFVLVSCGDVNVPIDKVEVNMPAPVATATPAPEVADDGIESTTNVVVEAEPILGKAELEPVVEEAITEVIEEPKPEWPMVMRIEQLYDDNDKAWYLVESYKCDALVNRDPVTMVITVSHKGTCASYEIDFEATYVVLGWSVKNVKSTFFGKEGVVQGGDTLNGDSKYDPRITITASWDMRSTLGKFEVYGYSLIEPVD
jgi:hypothetical protein